MKENIFVSLPGLFVRLLEFPVTQGDLTACFIQVTRVLPFTYFAWSSCEFVRFLVKPRRCYCCVKNYKYFGSLFMKIFFGQNGKEVQYEISLQKNISGIL